MYHETERRQVSLRVFNNEPTARMAEQRLRAEGIPCLIRPLRGGPGLWGTAYNLPHDLLVYEADEVRAREGLQVVARKDWEHYDEDDNPSSLMPRWIVTTAIVAIVLFVMFGVVIADQ